MLRRRSPRGAGCPARPSAVSRTGSGFSAMTRKPRKDALRSVNLFADRRFPLGVERQVHVHARAEADEAVALAALQLGARLDVAKDAPRDQAGDLHAGHVAPGGGAQPEGVALVLERGFVERRA